MWIYVVLLILLLTGSCYAAEPVRTGADQLFDEPYISWVKGKGIGLITNQTGLNGQLVALSTLLSDHPGTRIQALFAPEHGMEGTAQAGEKIESSAKVFSLYGIHERPTAAMLDGVEILVFDIQDVGSRFYTYISTMQKCMQAAAESGIPFIVLDRPNPIGGDQMEGPLLEPGLESFVGIAQIPIRHGLTTGEMAFLLRSKGQLDLNLRVVPLSGWNRSKWFDETGLTWIAPSPNMPTLETAIVYPGLCLIEGTNLSEGRGTTLPFQLIGAPWLDSIHLAGRLNALKLKGVRFRPQAFTPTFSKYAGQRCSGIQIHVRDRRQFSPIRTAMHILRQIKINHPKKLQFEERFFDQLAGNRWIRKMLQDGSSVESIVLRWQADLERFKKERGKFLLY